MIQTKMMQTCVSWEDSVLRISFWSLILMIKSYMCQKLNALRTKTNLLKHTKCWDRRLVLDPSTCVPVWQISWLALSSLTARGLTRQLPLRLPASLTCISSIPFKMHLLSFIPPKLGLNVLMLTYPSDTFFWVSNKASPLGWA